MKSSLWVKSWLYTLYTVSDTWLYQGDFATELVQEETHNSHFFKIKNNLIRAKIKVWHYKTDYG